ncbi:YybS family protein [Virgibacillus oceani]|uniref:Membrane protein n=1 Tax=Virgibacillus oceani TaxID=1479511 RepID=A0A917HF34_9BACI|nr:YybS family protein [Virgibacillus oceani]GGG76448.1 membrane protein [Virgibacillus oceani]
MIGSKKLTDGALLTAIYIVLLLVAFYIPLIELIATFLLPIPFIIFASRHDWKPALVMLSVSAVLSGLFATVLSLPLTILMGIGGIMIGSAIHKGLSSYETWARGTVGFVIGIVFIFLVTQLVFDVNIVNEMDSMIDESMQISQDIMEQFGLAEQAEEQMELIDQSVAMLKNLIPVGIALIAIVMAFLSQWISYKVINRLDNKKLHFPPFRDLVFPTALVWIYFFTLIVSYFQLDRNGTLFLAVNNILVLTGLLMTIQGFSFIFYFAHQKNKSKALPIGSVILTLLFPFLLLYLVRILGIIDIGFRLRDRIVQDKK